MKVKNSIVLMTHDLQYARAKYPIGTFIKIRLQKHMAGDWGDLPEADKIANDKALETGAQLFSKYNLPAWAQKATKQTNICIVSDPVSNPKQPRITTVMFPSDY